jgi:hypothetical protein
LENDVDFSKSLETARENTKMLVKEGLNYNKLNSMNHIRCSELLDQRKQARFAVAVGYKSDKWR